METKQMVENFLPSTTGNEALCQMKLPPQRERFNGKMGFLIVSRSLFLERTKKKLPQLENEFSCLMEKPITDQEQHKKKLNC